MWGARMKNCLSNESITAWCNYDELNFINPAFTVSFSGHRPDRLPGKGDPNTMEAQKLILALRKQIEDAVRCGKIFYLHGGMAGFDIFAGEQVIEMKKQYPQIQLVTVAPYKQQFFSREKCWTPDWISRAQNVFDKQDIGVKIAEYYRKGIYYKRNRALINHSSLLISYHDGGAGGTKFTIDYAKEKGLTVRNLYEGVE